MFFGKTTVFRVQILMFPLASNPPPRLFFLFHHERTLSRTACEMIQFFFSVTYCFSLIVIFYFMSWIPGESSYRSDISPVLPQPPDRRRFLRRSVNYFQVPWQKAGHSATKVQLNFGETEKNLCSFSMFLLPYLFYTTKKATFQRWFFWLQGSPRFLLRALCDCYNL